MPVVIIAKQEGFRRCGESHSAAPATWPDNRWSPAELAALQADPMLVVRVEPSEPTETRKAKG